MILNDTGLSNDIDHFRYSEILNELSGPTGALIEIGIIVIILLMSLRFASPVLSLGTLCLAGGYIALAVFFFLYVGAIFQFTRPLLIMLWALGFLLIGMGIEKRVGLVITDVCDKGVGAALFMALFRSFIRVLSGSAHSDGHLEIGNLDTKPEQILLRTIRSINNYISITHEQAGMFATIFYGILEPQTGELAFINGGHETPIILGPGGIKTILKPTGPAVGLYPHLKFKTSSIIMEPQDTLLVYTDGVTDVQKKAGAAFTKNRLINLAENSFATAEDLITKIKTGVNEHISSENQFDDITIVALRRKA